MLLKQTLFKEQMLLWKRRKRRKSHKKEPLKSKKVKRTNKKRANQTTLIKLSQNRVKLPLKQ